MNLFIEILPMGLGAAVSPVMLALVFIVLMKGKPKNVLAFMLGALIVFLAVTALSIFASNYFSSHSSGAGNLGHWVDVLLGVILIFLGIRSKDRKKDKKHQESASGKQSLTEWFIIGFLTNLVNFTTFIFLIEGGKMIAIDQGSHASKVVSFSYLMLMSLLPAWLPLILYVADQKEAKKILDPINAYFKKSGATIAVYIYVILGIYLIYKGGAALI